MQAQSVKTMGGKKNVMCLVGLSMHAQKWHMTSSKQGGGGSCKQVLLVQSSLIIGVRMVIICA